MMVTSKILILLYILYCKMYQVLLSHHCSATTGPGVIQCDGKVWTEPASVIQMGQNISVNCHSDKKFCQNAKIHMRLNNVDFGDRLLSVINKTTVQLRLHNYETQFSIVTCYADCPQERISICGTQFCMGYLPDMPTNLTCVIYEYSDNMTCTWNPGKDTHLSTSYKLYLKSFQEEEHKNFSANNASVTIPLRQMQKNQTFSVWVRAENALGRIHSEQLHVDLNDLVVPAIPVITQHTTVDSPVFKTTIQWEKRSAINEMYCEERYKEITSDTWHVREWDAGLKGEHHTEYNLDASKKYEFQVRCKLTCARSIWSKWSESAVYTTPEAEPSSVLDVWRYLGPTYQNGSREVTILIKPFFPKESRGTILGYRVFYENEGAIMDLCKTTKTKCKVLVPPAVSIVYVTAHNSKGSSKPANITMKQQPHNYHDFPPPTNMKIILDEQKGISAVWEPPQSIGKIVLWYIVELTYADVSHDIVWKKVPIQNITTYMKEKIRMESDFNISVYAVYQDGISEACSVQTLAKKDQDGRDTYLERTSAATNGRKDDDYDVGVLLGTGFGVASLCVFILGLIAKKSCRKRVNTVFHSVTPKWLLEDYPKVQKSNVIKSLQEKNGPVIHNSTGLFLHYEDAVVTEVEETLVHKEYKVVGDKEKAREAILEKVNIPEEIVFVGNSDMTEENGYKPQVLNKAVLSYQHGNINEIHSQSPDDKPNSPALPVSSLIKDYPSPMATMWPITGANENIFLFDKISLVLNNSRSGQSNIVSSADEEPHTPIESQLKFLFSDEDIQEQTLIPEELLSCLKNVNEDSSNLMSYFPQNIAK
ncbi:interleukin-23 receptor [Rhineura floridana]|uniref:interleukin-23 receptor n=1 Tax=Rhineura floridana TaxID=261503 RepID=UPI002AC7E7AE|nr:interleukin-23 receptor [Rhineura floridana]